MYHLTDSKLSDDDCWSGGPGNLSYVFDWMICDKADVDVFCAIIGKGDKTCQVYYGISSAL